MPVAPINISSLFPDYCEKSIQQLSQECLASFGEAQDELTRVKLLYGVATGIPITIAEKNGKSFQDAQQYKIQGNAHFADKNYDEALQSYNKGIIKCPQDSNGTRELLTILISNRSATYYELKEYKRVFNDIDYLLEIGNYPPHLQYKIWVRKGKCYSALQNERLSAEAYDQAIDSLKFSKLDEETIEMKRKEIEAARKNKIPLVPKHELVPYTNPEIFIGGKEYISAHPKISFEQDSYQGRYAVASDYIPIGTVIAEENPHCAVLDANHTLTNCQYCFKSVDQPIACQNCSTVVFCSTICERLANKSYHRVECPTLRTLFESGASVNCVLALRIISQRHYSYFNDKKNKLKDYFNDSCTKNVIKKKNYRFDDYDNVFFLCRNENMNKSEEIIRFSVMANYLLRLLKYGKYFPFATDDTVLRDEETYIGALILRHLQLSRFNAHEISELKNPSKPINIRGLVSNYESTTIGAGIYPTLALFNHSCDPSIVRYNIKNKMVVRTIKPLKAGDIIYENYGPLYMAMPLETRREILKKIYWFECLCKPCVEMWPLFDEMKENELRIACSTDGCPFVFIVHDLDDPFLTCSYCHRMTTILGHIKGLMILDTILPEAEALFGLGQYDNAMKKFIEGLEILYKFIKPPHPDIVKVQQRIRVCMVHMGNTACNYKSVK